MEWADFCERYTCNISFEKFIDIRYILKLSIQKLNLPNARLNCASFPQKPFLIDMSLCAVKGCSMYYKMLMKKTILTNTISVREAKWHHELGTNFSLNFWNNSRSLCASINFDNKLKWLQFQIIRNSLQTNYIVSHFKRTVSKKCQYCSQSDELVSHLFWTCHVVNSFLNNIYTFFTEIHFEYIPSKAQMIFGFHELPFSHPKNYISLIIKRYVWKTKFQSCQLNLSRFKGLLKSYMVDLKYIFDMKNVPEQFNEWNVIFDAL